MDSSSSPNVKEAVELMLQSSWHETSNDINRAEIIVALHNANLFQLAAQEYKELNRSEKQLSMEKFRTRLAKLNMMLPVDENSSSILRLVFESAGTSTLMADHYHFLKDAGLVQLLPDFCDSSRGYIQKIYRLNDISIIETDDDEEDGPTFYVVVNGKLQFHCWVTLEEALIAAVVVKQSGEGESFASVLVKAILRMIRP